MGASAIRLVIAEAAAGAGHHGDTAVEGGDWLARLIGSVEMTSGDSAKTMAPETAVTLEVKLERRQI